MPVEKPLLLTRLWVCVTGGSSMDEALDAVRCVWASKWNDRAVLSMRKAGQPHSAVQVGPFASLIMDNTAWPAMPMMSLEWRLLWKHDCDSAFAPLLCGVPDVVVVVVVVVVA